MVTEVFPLGTMVLAAEVKKERRTESGIYLEGANSVKETAAARVLAVGPDVTRVRVGDEVYLDWSKTKLVVVESAQRVLLDQDEIMAIVVTQ